MSLLELRDVHKEFSTKDSLVKAVDGVSLSLEKGESLALIGPSGSGKSTLLNMIGLLISPDRGEILLEGMRIDSLSDAKRCAIRNSSFGYVVQDFALLEDETVYRNIQLPLLYHKIIPRQEHRERINAAAKAMGIADKTRRTVTRLSGGERQRVAIARALVCDQPILLADEPTGSLDGENKDMVMDLLMDSIRTCGKSMIIVTHDPSVAARCNRTIQLADGKIQSK